MLWNRRGASSRSGSEAAELGHEIDLGPAMRSLNVGATG